jgi:hypothetical protein
MLHINRGMKETSKSPSSKICSKCGEKKAVTDYYTKGRSPKGHSYFESHCKVCSVRKSVARENTKKAADPAFRDMINASSSARSAEYQRNMRRNPAMRGKCVLIDSRKADRKRGHQNDLTLECVEALIAQPCKYCGATNLPMTLDRKDNALGHLTANIVPACIRCNLVRGRMPYNAWLVIAEAMRAAHEQGLFGDWTAEISRAKMEESGGIEPLTHR